MIIVELQEAGGSVARHPPGTGSKLRHCGKWLLLAGAHTQPLITMPRDGFIDRLGPGNACENIDEALRRARALIAVPPGG